MLGAGWPARSMASTIRLSVRNDLRNTGNEGAVSSRPSVPRSQKESRRTVLGLMCTAVLQSYKQNQARNIGVSLSPKPQKERPVRRLLTESGAN